MWSTRIAMLVSWTVALTAAAAAAQEPSPPDPRFAAAAAKETEDRLARIREEVAALGADHAWAGRYYHGDGLGVNVTVDLAPRAGFVFQWHGCLGLYDRNHGPVVERDGRLELAFTFPNAVRGIGLAPVLLPVAWGERRYLLAGDQQHAFVNAVNSGLEPRTGSHGCCLLRSGDEKRPVQGAPALPAQVAGLLLAEPVTGTVVAVHESRIEERDGSKWRVTEATIDRGTRNGLWAGMRVHLRERGVGGTAAVAEVEEHQARIRIRDFLFQGEKGGVPEVGCTWSTRLPGKD